jgi:hypothetical protein
MSCILRGIPGLALLSGILDMDAAFLDLMGIAGLGITGALMALIVRRYGWGLGHLLAPLLLGAGQRAANTRVSCQRVEPRGAQRRKEPYC